MILSVGEILIDSFKSVNSTSICVGGAPFNVAVAVKRAGGKVGFVGKIGDDNEGKFILDNVNKYNLDWLEICILKGHKTTVAEVILDDNGERHFKFYRDDTADFQLELKDVNLDKICPSILHIGTLMLSEDIGRKFALELLGIAKEKGVKISIDVNLRDDLFKDKTERNLALKPFVENADFLKMSLDEMLDYTSQFDLANAVRSLNCHGVLFVTDGSNGCHIFVGDDGVHIPSKRVEAVDTTGAGDAFWGTALAGIDTLLDGGTALTIDSLKEIGKKSNLAGAEAVTHIGAI